MPKQKLNPPTNRASREVGNQIRTIRERKGISQETLAKRVKMTRQNYARIEYGQTNVTLDSLIRIAKALGVECHISFRRRRTSQARSR